MPGRPVPNPNVPTDASGLPIFNAGGVPVANSDPTNIWFDDLPTALQGVKIFYDIGHRAVERKTLGPGLAPGQDVITEPAKPGAANTVEPFNKQVTPQDILKQIAAMQANDPNGLESIQALMSSGVWGTVHVSGVFDKDTENAIINAMERYYKLSHGSGVAMSFMQYIQSSGTRALQNQQAQKAAGSSSTPTQVSLQDPATIKQYAQSAAQSALGRNLSEDQLNTFVDQYQAAQRAAETSTASSVTAPDLSSEAMAFVQQQNPQAYAQNEHNQYLDALVNMFGGNRPSANEPVSPVG